MNDHWPRLAALFDELSELDPVQRRLRLQDIASNEPEIANPLAAMLAADQVEEGLLDEAPGRVMSELVDGQVQPEWETQPGSGAVSVPRARPQRT